LQIAGPGFHRVVEPMQQRDTLPALVVRDRAEKARLAAATAAGTSSASPSLTCPITPPLAGLCRSFSAMRLDELAVDVDVFDFFHAERPARRLRLTPI
jgi:hypothetical protein